METSNGYERKSFKKIVIGLGGQTQGVPRETGFDITAASEIMAILCLSKDLEDLKEKIGNIFVGYTYDKKPIYARDLNAQGAVATLLKDAIKPNLVQTLENTPAIIHGGPFANIAQGTNSLIATKMGLSLSDYVITEAGFASELGAEKFLDIKARYGGLKPDAVVIVATIRALKYHGGVGLKELANPNPEAVKIGLENLDKHIENVQHFKIQPIVALNQFVTDSKAELEVLENHLKAKNVKYALNSSWAHGGDGALDFAKVVVETVNAGKSNFEPLYELDWSMEKRLKP